MSNKYPYFGKRGRPSKLETEVCLKINKLIETGDVTQAEIDAIVDANGMPVNQEELETMFTFLSGETPFDDGSTPNSKDNIPPESNSEFDGGDGLHDDGIKDSVPPKSHVKNPDAMEFDPFAEPVIDRPYTKGLQGQGLDEGTGGEESVTDESTSEDSGVKFDNQDFDKPEGGESVAHEVGGGGDEPPPDDGTTDGIADTPFTEIPPDDEEVIAEPEWSNTVEAEIVEAEEEEESDEKLGGDNLQDLSPAQKRKACEATAEAILDLYCQFIPLPFIRLASFRDIKVQKLALEGKIDLNMQLENGVTIQDYINSTNAEAEQIFIVDDETRESIREPLIEVLMENEVALTPMQRLMMAVGAHVVTMGFNAIKLMNNNKLAMETFIKFRDDVVRQGGGSSYNEPASQNKEPAQSAKADATPNYSTHEINDHEKKAVEDLMEEINKGDDGVIDPNNDASVTIEEVTKE